MFYEYSLYKYASICLGLTAFSAYIPHARCHFNTRKTLLCHFKKHANFSNDLHTCFMICKLYIFGFWTVKNPVLTVYHLLYSYLLCSCVVLLMFYGV